MDETCEFCGTGHYSHKTLVCGAKVAHLEAANAALAAALEWYKERAASLACCKGQPDHYAAAIVVELSADAGKRARAALSDGGKGWLKGLPFSALVSAWVKAQPEMVAGIREGVRAMKEGRVTPWEDVERELFGGEGRLGAKGTCNEHPDGCPEGSHREG